MVGKSVSRAMWGDASVTDVASAASVCWETEETQKVGTCRGGQ